MYKTKLCLGIDGSFGIDTKEQIRLFRQTGFEAFFTGWDSHLKEYKKWAEEFGMIYQSVHAPFGNAAKMWHGEEEAKPAVAELLQCVRDCAEAGVELLIVHPYIGFETEENPTQQGIENFRQVVEEAKKDNVQIAFENVEGESYLQALMGAFSEEAHVGFCWDSGHEQCYNRGKDMLALYGDRLIATHLNDNLGISDYEGKIFWTDDLHLLPMDGIIDWKNVAERLNKCKYDGILTFELSRNGKPNRHDNDKYSRLSIGEYVAECYARACKVAHLLLP